MEPLLLCPWGVMPFLWWCTYFVSSGCQSTLSVIQTLLHLLETILNFSRNYPQRLWRWVLVVAPAWYFIIPPVLILRLVLAMVRDETRDKAFGWLISFFLYAIVKLSQHIFCSSFWRIWQTFQSTLYLFLSVLFFCSTIFCGLFSLYIAFKSVICPSVSWQWSFPPFHIDLQAFYDFLCFMQYVVTSFSWNAAQAFNQQTVRNNVFNDYNPVGRHGIRRPRNQITFALAFLALLASSFAVSDANASWGSLSTNISFLILIAGLVSRHSVKIFFESYFL